MVDADASLIWDLVKDALAIVGKGLEYKSTRKNLESAVKELSPLVEKIEHSMNQMNLPTEHIQKLKQILATNRDALGKNKIHWWNCVLAPWFQWKLSREHTSLERFVSVQTQIHMLQLLTQILSVLSSQGRSNEHPTNSAHDDNNNNRTLISKDNHLDERFPRFNVGLDGDFMPELKAKLLHGDEQVLNLYGIPGSGKTTMAKKLCYDLQLLGSCLVSHVWTIDHSHQSEEVINMLQDRLSQCGEDEVLLVLDDVWPCSENIVEMINLRSPGSRILVTSRAKMTKVRTRCLMKLLCDEDAEKLLLHLIQPSPIDFDDPERRKILLQILEGCKGLPLAIEFIGGKLRGKPIEAFQNVQLEWSRGHSILKSHEDLLARLQNSVDESIKECFMDLGLFPEDQKIPVTALIDMWVELFDLNEPATASLSAMLIIQDLIAMNLAAGIKVRRIVGRDDVDNYYNNHFLMQHDLFRELAIHMSQQEPLVNRKRLIIEMYGNLNNPPKWWPKQQQSLTAPPIMSISTDQSITPDWCCNIQAAGTVVLVLNFKTKEYTLPDFIKGMENLKVLIITNYGLCKTDLRNLELLGSLMSLKRIRLQQVSIPCLCDLKNVHKLSLYMCEVKKAFENSSIEFSDAMPKLEDLSIEYCKDFVKLPSGLCDIVTMKNLTISSCHNFIRLPEEIGNLVNLELLRINYCTGFEEMPESITKLKNLSFLDISFCASLKMLPDKIGELQNLNKLYMTGCSIRELPESVKNFRNLESVICDEVAFHLWEDIVSCFSKINFKMAEMDVSLNWLS